MELFGSRFAFVPARSPDVEERLEVRWPGGQLVHLPNLMPRAIASEPTTHVGVDITTKPEFSMPRTMIAPKGDKRYIRRKVGRFTKSQDDVGRSLSADRRKKH
jgi:hypothetical protein